jgi:putative oxidoreductase
MSTITTSRDSVKTIPLSGLRAQLIALQDSRLTRSVALLSMRLALAWIFIYHGAGKLFNFNHQGGIAGTTAFFHLQGLPAPHLMAYVVGLTEFGGGLLLLIGFVVPLVGLALALDMVVAMVTTTLATGMLPKALPGGIVADGFEINLALLGLAVAVALLGAGRFSLDATLGLSTRRAKAQ